MWLMAAWNQEAVGSALTQEALFFIIIIIFF